MARYKVREFEKLMEETGQSRATESVEKALTIMDERGFELVSVTQDSRSNHWYFFKSKE